ncbi:MAG: hypothetical protein QM661_06355 [Solimonas sp.]
MDEYSIVRAYLISLGIGLLISLERKRAGEAGYALRSAGLVAGRLAFG